MRLWPRKPKPNLQRVAEPSQPETQPLTGIERMALAEAESLQSLRAEQAEARRRWVRGRIAEIEREIGPRMQELETLRTELQPSRQYQNMFNSMTGQQSTGMGVWYNALGAIGSPYR